MKYYLTLIYRMLFPANLDSVFSEQGKEQTALGIAARFSRGNINLQQKRVTTQRKFDEELKAMEARVANQHLAAY